MEYINLGGVYCDDLGDFRKAIEFFQQGLAIAKEVGDKETEIIERLRFTFTPNGKSEFVPRDQVSSLTVVYCLLLPLTIGTLRYSGRGRGGRQAEVKRSILGTN